jgi:hypothetical protein
MVGDARDEIEEMKARRMQLEKHWRGSGGSGESMEAS